MALLIREGRYLYWKETGGHDIYLGTVDKPKREAIEAVIAKLQKKKAGTDETIQRLKNFLQ